MPLAAPDLTTLGGAAALTSLLVEVLLRAWDPSTAMLHRFGPIVAILVGVVVTVLLGVVNHAPDLLLSGITGIFTGATAMGIQNFVTQTLVPPSPTDSHL